MKKSLLSLLLLCFALSGMASTDRDCPPPSHLTVSSVTAFTAHLDWEGTTDDYLVLLGLERLAFDVDFETGDFSQANFTTTTPDYPWAIEDFGQGSSFSAKSTNAGVGNSTSDMVLEVNLSTDMIVSFSAAVSSENGYDRGFFSIDGIDKTSCSGAIGWTSYSFPLTVGTHTLRWYYKKDMSTDAGFDCFYVDNIRIGYANEWDRFYTEESQYTFESLSDETSYLVKVVGFCDGEESEPSRTVSFTTTYYCRTPKELMVSGLTEKEATLNWVANGMSYYVQFGKLRPDIDADFETNDFSQASFTTSSSYPWMVVKDDIGNTICAKSGNKGVDNTTSSLLLEVNADSETFVSFSSRVSSESSFDKGYFSIDNEEEMVVSGEVGWADYVYPMTAGTHTLRWYYAKDSSGDAGDDCFYVDNIKFGAVNRWEDYDTDELYYTFTDLEPKTTYVTRVQSSCEVEMSAFSKWLGFTTPSNHMVSEYPAEDNAEPFAYYNNGSLVIIHEGCVTLRIIDALGRTVCSQNLTDSQNVDFDVKAGVYVLQLIQDENVRTQKVVIR
ncbi:MAG: T9SS type A sorting domain-containing protein [Bacteroidales bacterium]|nr:T9SS type A sorting domain-containing protein [Bacteroidales bacterium]